MSVNFPLLKLLQPSMSTLLSNNRNQPRFRSVNYRLSRGLSLQMGDKSTPVAKQLAMPATCSTRNPIPSLYHFRNSRYPKQKQNLSMTNVTEPQNIRSQPYITAESPQESDNKTSYIDTFNILCAMEKTRNSLRASLEDTSSDKLASLMHTENVPRFGKVQLPALAESDSHFTVLDNINLPIQYIKQEIKKVRKHIAAEEGNLGLIRADLRIINNKISKQIEEISKRGMSEFDRLYSLLRANKVVQQEQLMKHKSSFAKCQKYLPEYYQQLQQSKDRLISLQDTIFKQTPFQLHYDEQVAGQSPAYF